MARSALYGITTLLKFIYFHDFSSYRSGMRITEKILNVLELVPGKEKFGPYRFLPVFFLLGAAIEFSMIHWKPNGINFYERYKAKHAYEEALKRYNRWKEIQERIEE